MMPFQESYRLSIVSILVSIASEEQTSSEQICVPAVGVDFCNPISNDGYK